jgi:hypothetical protein
MKSHPSANEVLEELGDKIVEGLAVAVAKAADDLADYRAWRPDIVAGHSERGLANWLHDRVWRHVTAEFEMDPEVTISDAEPVREFWVGLKYRFRVKRHNEEGAVRAYPTQTVLEFMIQQPMLDGDAEVRLIVGYEWDKITRKMGPAVISLHDGLDDPVWLVRLPDPRSGGVATVLVPPVTGPAPTSIQMKDDVAEGGGTMPSEGGEGG